MTITFLFFILLSSIPLVNVGMDEAEGGEASLSRPGIQPGSGADGDSFLFIVTLTASESPDDPVELVLNNNSYEMNEVNPGDTNFSDGKDFYFRKDLEAGGVVYFYRIGNVTTTAKTLSIAESDRFQYHYDVALFMSLFIIPVIVILLYLRKIEQHLRNIASRRQDPGTSSAPKDSHLGNEELH